MELLLDTNIFLEVFLDQAHAADARRILTTGDHTRWMTDFSLHSIGVLLFRRSLQGVFGEFVKDIISPGVVRIVSLPEDQVPNLCAASRRFGLDFDDAYQYATARWLNLSLVSFDSDFDRTNLPRLDPSHI
ncbi:PIN domain-containing protein [Deferrisoma camini]|uniref:PIN domain-containing protein n=1 Tax=Deferrisoma camini TaxID=1035120 RepID=UPI00046D033C|nr:PIN domain-containing protein [Deferrisoma camini]